MTADERRLLVRMKFLRYMQHEAAKEGDIMKYVGMVEDFCRGFNGYFNGPGLRHRVRHQCVDALEFQIISGALNTLAIL